MGDFDSFSNFWKFARGCAAPDPRYTDFVCGEDIKEGLLVYGVSRVYVVREWGRMIQKFARGIAVESGKMGDTISVQTYGSCTIIVGMHAEQEGPCPSANRLF